MPCRVDDPYPVYAQAGVTQSQYDNLKREYEKMRKLADKLTHENDMLREDILSGDIDAKRLAKITREQVAHRKEDLKRLEAAFTKSHDAARLAKVWEADPKNPLTEQLGFDPDEF